MLTSTSNVKRHTENGVTTDFPFDFKVDSPTELEVDSIDLAGVPTRLSYPGDFTVTGLHDNDGGYITKVAGTNGFDLLIRRITPTTQTTKLRGQTELDPVVLEEALDKLAKVGQQLAEELTRTFRSSVEGLDLELPAPEAGYALGWDATRTKLVNVPNTGADQDADLADTTSAVKGAGKIGFNSALAYEANTVGAFLRSLISSAGASLIGFLQSGTGAVLRLVQDKLRDSVHVADFGAVGDGTTDDTVNMQKAIDAVSTYGGTVWHSDKAYVISGDGLQVPSGVYLRGKPGSVQGSKRGTKFIAKDATVNQLVCFNGFDSGMEDIVLEGEATKAVDGIAIGLNATSGAEIPGRIYFRNVTTRLFANGWRSINGSFLLSWVKCVAWGNATGWFFDNTGSVLARGVNIASLDGCHSVGNTSYGLNSIVGYCVDIKNHGFDSDAIGIRFESTNGSIKNGTSDLSSTASISLVDSRVEMSSLRIYASQLPISINTVSNPCNVRISDCITTGTVGTLSVGASTDSRIVFDGNVFDKTVQNDGERFEHAYRTEGGFLTITAGGGEAELTRAITFSRAFSTLKYITVIPEAGFTKRVNTLYSGASAAGFTARFQRDDGSTWTAAQTQSFSWTATGID